MKPAYDARIITPQDGFQRNLVTLAIRDNALESYLMPDGTWLRVGKGTYPERMGINLPSATIEAIALAVQEYQGHTSHADTEARVLREWLTVERARVDKALER